MILSALWYLQSRSLVNRIRSRVLRLRQPKYLIGAVVGFGYLWMVGFRHLFTGAASHRPPVDEVLMSPEFRLGLQSIAMLMFLIFLVGSWVFAGDRASLQFSEAEVAFLFPAPVSRRMLIQFRLIRLLLGSLFSAVVFNFFTGRAMHDGHGLFRLAGLWVALSALALHALGASFASQRLTERGLSGTRRRLLVLGVVGLLTLAIWSWGRAVAAERFPGGFQEFVAWLGRIPSVGPVPWLFMPLRWVVAPWFAESWPEFIRSMIPALAVLMAHYVWVIRSDVAFEEASIEASRKRAERLVAAQEQRLGAAPTPTRPRRDPFVLAPTGFPPMALLWKNLISAGQMFTLRFWLILVWILLVGGTLASGVFKGSQETNPVQLILAGFSVVVFLLSFALGPQVFRNDFRTDLKNADWLKALPLPAWQIALGELMAPVCLMVGVQWILLLLVGILSRGLEISDGPQLDAWRWQALGSAFLLCAPLDLLLIALPNAAALLFPAWVQIGADRQAGIEAMGQRMIFVAGQMLILLVALLPSSAVGFGVIWAASRLIELPNAIPLGAVAMTIMLAIEGWLVVRALGVAFSRFDVSQETG